MCRTGKGAASILLENCFSKAFALGQGETVALIGCGGKTTLMFRLAAENRRRRTVVTTTTHIAMPAAGLVDCLMTAPYRQVPVGITLAAGGILDGKVTAISEAGLYALRDADLLLIEGDGSKGLPLKGWAAHEPVVPEAATLTIGVCVAHPIGRPLSEENVHRPDRFESLTGAVMGEICAPAHIAAMISGAQGLFQKARGRRALFINQIEDARDRAKAQAVLAALPSDFRRTLHAIVLGSAQRGVCEWVDIS